MGTLSWIFSSLTIAVICIGIASSILWLLRKRVSHLQLKKHHDVAGFVLGTVGVLYSVVLGFTVVNAQDRYNRAANTVHTEATMLADLYRDAAFFPENTKLAVRLGLQNYVQYILDEEWANKRDHLRAERAISNLWKGYREIDLSSEIVKIWYSQSVSKVDDLMNARLTRQFYMNERLGGMMWTLLILGAVITVSLLFFFGLENLLNQMVMMNLLVGYLSFMLYLVYCLDTPFKGALAIRPTSLEQNLVFFKELD